MDKLLNYFFNEPEQEFHVRELAKLSGFSPTTVSKYLNKLKKNDLLCSRKQYNHLLFKANTDSGAFMNAKLLFNLEKLRKSGLIKFLIEEYNQPEAIILFGSYAKAENINKSDIDLFVISPLKKELNLDRFEEKLGHPIQIFVYSKVEIEKMKKSNKELLNSLVNGFVINGYWEMFR